MTSMAPDSNLALLEEARSLLASLTSTVANTTDSGREDRLRLARVDFYCASIYNYAGQPARTMPYYQRVLPVARELAEEFGEQELLLRTSMVILLSEITHGHMDKARETIAPMLGPVEKQLGINIDAMRCLQFTACVLYAVGQRQAASRLTERAHALGLQINQPATMGVFFVTKATNHVIAMEHADALLAAKGGLECANQNGQSLHLYSALDVIAWVQSQAGQHAQALDTRAQSVEVRRSLKHSMLADWWDALEAEILLNAGRHEQALEKARQVATTSRAAGLLFSTVIAERIWGSALSRLGADLVEVEAHLRTSLQLAERHAQVSHAAQAELFWGRALYERGQRAAAQPHFARALEVLESGGYERGLEWARSIIAS